MNLNTLAPITTWRCNGLTLSAYIVVEVRIPSARQSPVVGDGNLHSQEWNRSEQNMLISPSTHT